jgi:Tol biopolymer transport system component
LVAGSLLCATGGSTQAEPYVYSTVREISDKFGPLEVKKLKDLLNIPQFQSPLTNYSCGEAVPKLTFSVSLRPKGYATTRAVEISYTPGFSPSDYPKRCLMFAVDYLLDKAVAGLDPDPRQETTREPHCDCSKRDGKTEWVEFPGPDEILAPKKVAAKNAAMNADADQQVQEEDLQPIRFDPADVQVTATPGEVLVTHETPLGKMPVDAQMIVASHDFTHWACVLKRNGKESVMLDGVEGKAYDAIPYHQQLEFSADGKHLAYVAKSRDKMMVVLDGKEGKSYEDVEDLFHPKFSPDGQHLAYIAATPAIGIPPVRMFMVLDGKEQKGYQLVEGILFSHDSRHLAYNADRKWNRGTSVVLDGNEGPTFDQVSGTCFSPDGNRIAYVAFNRTNRSPGSMGMDFAVVDGKEEKHYKSVSSIQFSPDSRHVTYIAGVDNSSMRILVRDGVEMKYANANPGTFSPDSQHLAYAARFGTNWLVLVDGKRLDPKPKFARADPMFSPATDVSFSPDSRHIAYVRLTETNPLVVLDGKVIATQNGMLIAPRFTSDSRRLAYVAGRGPIPGATGQGSKARPVLGGLEGKDYDQMLTWRADLDEGGETFGFTLDERGALHGIAVSDREVLRIELEIVKR